MEQHSANGEGVQPRQYSNDIEELVGLTGKCENYGLATPPTSASCSMMSMRGAKVFKLKSMRSIQRHIPSGPGVYFRMQAMKNQKELMFSFTIKRNYENAQQSQIKITRSMSLNERAIQTSESDCMSSSNDRALKNNDIGSPTKAIKRRSSLTTALYASHLVPNRVLMSTSRRISTHSPNTLCQCTSCYAKITPYWRDGWANDIMLCNACGLRFQKFAQRCPECAYIPRKEDGQLIQCPQCKRKWDDQTLVRNHLQSKDFPADE